MGKSSIDIAESRGAFRRDDLRTIDIAQALHDLTKNSQTFSFISGKGKALSALSNYPMELPMLLIPQRHTAAVTHDRTASS
jgi:hypothetical protein